ncbi:hypothetical protein ACHAXR_012578 [Thalassiosira sp. AJA248-18]
MGRATLFSQSPWASTRRGGTDVETELIPWARAFLTIYLIASIPFRIAFYPDFKLSFDKYPAFVILDLLATIFFSYETIRLSKLLWRAISPSSILPTTSEPPKEDSVGHSIHSIHESADAKPQRTFWSYQRVFFHFVSTVPFEYLSMLFFDGDLVNYLLLNRLLRIFYLPKYLEDLSTVLGRKGYLSNIGVRRTWILFFTMALAGHLCGCGFFFVARLQALDGASLTWPEVAGIYSIDAISIVEGQHQVELTMESTTSEAYIKSLYWAYITMITTGFGDIVPLHISETVWCIISMFIGVVITALTIANLQRTIGQFDHARLIFQRKMELIKKFMHYRCLPKDIQERVLSFYDHQWVLLKGADEERFLTELPRTLQQQVTNYMCRDIIASLPILRRANRSLLNVSDLVCVNRNSFLPAFKTNIERLTACPTSFQALVECAEMNIFSPNDNIVKCGEKICGALLVSQGEVEVLKGSITERKMHRLDRFAQECLFVEKLSAYTVRSKGFSEVILIPRTEFQQIINSQCDKEHIAQLRETATTINSKTTTKANKMFGSGEDITPTSGFKKHCHPNSFFRKVWDCLILLGLIFYTFSVPLSFMHLVENTPIGDTPLLLGLGYATDVFFWIDAILEWNYFFYHDSGLVVFDRDHIRQHFYSQHNFAREIAGLVPFDLVSCFFGGRFCHHFRLAKLVRLPNIAMHMESVEVMLSELKIDIDLSLYRVIKLNVLMLVVCHWCGCLWYMMASLSIALGQSENWRYADENHEVLSISHSDFGGFAAYLRSIYWAIVGMSTVGYGDIIPTNIIETTFATVVILFGGLVLPAVVGGLAAYISNLNMSAKLFQKRISKVRMYLLRINVGDDVLDKVSRYYDYHWSCQGGVMELEVMDELPNSLRNAVSSNVCGTMINSLPFLCRCEDATKQVIASILQPRVFMPTDCIVQEGERGFEMYFLKRGQAVVTASSIRGPISILSKHDFFGESCLLGSSLSGATVKACTYCECFSLNRDDFKDAISGSSFAEQAAISSELEHIVTQAKGKNQRALHNFSAHPKCLQLTMDPASEGPLSIQPAPQALILPGSSFLLVWNSFLLCVCVYNAWIIPFRLAFDTSNNSIAIDWVFDVFFLLDMLLNYRFAAYIQDGELVTDIRKIKHNYAASRLKLDLISSLPLDLIAYFVLPEAPIVGELLRVLKMIRLGRHFGTLDRVFGFLEDHNISLAGLRLVEFLSGVVLIAHWAACGFFFIARLKSSRANCSDIVRSDKNTNEWASALAECLWEGTWIDKQIHDGKLPVGGGETWQHYIRSFNWALPTLVVVVIGDVVPVSSPETLYAFLLMAIGVTVNAAIVGNVANIVANLETDSSDFARRVDEIRNYMHKHHLSYDLHERVDDFTRYLWMDHSGSTNEDEFILRLPYTLQTDVFAQTRTKLLLQCPFFDFCDNDIVKALAMCLRPCQYSAADVIVHAGDFGQSMFFLEAGTVQVVPSDGSTVLATLVAGSFFGETSQPRASSVCAVTFCDVFELGKADLFNELRRRDIDIGDMLKLFAIVHDRNSRRYTAVQKNLSASKRQGTKLNKIMDSRDEPSAKKRAVMSCYLPGSIFRFCWDVTCLVLIIYFLVLVLYRIAFRADGEGHIVLFDLMADAFFISDFYLRSTHFAFTRYGSVCNDRRLILQRYVRSGMLIDGLSCLSILETFCPRLQFRLLCLLRILRIPYFFKKIREHLSLRGIRISLATHLLGTIIFFYAIANHWVACIWFIIHRYIERKVESTWATSDCPWDTEVGSDGCLAKWNETLGEHNICNADSMVDCYLRSLHFSITTLSTVGYGEYLIPATFSLTANSRNSSPTRLAFITPSIGDISPVSELETIWENIVVLLGACFLAGLIGAFGAYLSECDTLGFNAFKEKIQMLKKYMTYRTIPGDIQASILYFHHCRWKDSQTLDERETLRILPAPLQLDISFAVKRRVIRLVPILDSLPTIVQKRIAHALIMQVYSFREHPIIYSQGDIGWEIYFIVSGVVSISLPTDFSELDMTGRSNAAANKQKFESIGLILGAGNHVGESCICSESGVRQETVAAMTMKVEAYALSKEDLDDICRLMGSEKGSQLRHALLTRNARNWHSFDEIEGISANWDDNTDTSSHERQSSYKLLPWATPKNNNSLVTESGNNRGTVRRRRRTSQPNLRSSFSASPGSIKMDLRLNEDERSDYGSPSSIV